ncbi:MAG: sulfatase [Planctomycetota bacterium]|nr:MAG: sulfatase [Planctomycetota bacterium]
MTFHRMTLPLIMQCCCALWLGLLTCVTAHGQSQASAERPNVLWIFVDDMSDWVGCYGDPTVPTPHIDGLAAAGVRFDRAYMPSPVCSTTRSAIITGCMQTTLGLHHHRTMIKRPLPDHVLTVPELFRQAGYLTFNEAKDDYNFQKNRDAMYSPEFRRPGIRTHLVGTSVEWLQQLGERPFFGQIQLAGGKLGGETGSRYPAPSRVMAAQVQVPPQYPDTPVFRNAIARHYEQIAQTDAQVGAILDALERYGLRDNTAVFFFTDHGSPLPRSKQFLYEEGVRVPLIVHWPRGASRLRRLGTVRQDLVSGIDIAATSLALAGIPIPRWMESRDVFAEDYRPRRFVVSARDRNGIAVDRIRAVRTADFVYIRNFKTDRALYQPNYRDEYATFQELWRLYNAGQLTPVQSAYHRPDARPAEELYAWQTDPHQVHNLADDPAYADVLRQHREFLESWIDATGDQGQYPEDPAALRLLYEQYGDRCVAPEFDFLRDR